MRLLNDEWAQISVGVFDEERFSNLANHEEIVVHAPTQTSEPGEINSPRLRSKNTDSSYQSDVSLAGFDAFLLQLVNDSGISAAIYDSMVDFFMCCK